MPFAKSQRRMTLIFLKPTSSFPDFRITTPDSRHGMFNSY